MGAGIVDDPYPVFHELLAAVPGGARQPHQHFPNPAEPSVRGHRRGSHGHGARLRARLEALRQAGRAVVGGVLRARDQRSRSARASSGWTSPSTDACASCSRPRSASPRWNAGRATSSSRSSTSTCCASSPSDGPTSTKRWRPTCRCRRSASRSVSRGEDRQKFFDWAVGMTSGGRHPRRTPPRSRSTSRR